MLSIFDLVPLPAFTQAPQIAESPGSTLWIIGYAVVGGLILAAVLIIIKQIVNSTSRKDK